MTDAASFTQALTAVVGADRVRRHEPLAAHTTFRVGGPADWWAEPHGREALLAALRVAHAHGVPVTLLGGGTNVIVADAGIRGLVLHPRGGSVDWHGPSRVRADAAISINGLVRWCLTNGAAGVEAWAGTPGTVGGAIYGNAHWGGESIGDHLVSVEVADRTGRVYEVTAEAMAFAYDTSRLQQSGEVLVTADLRVTQGMPDTLRATARASLAYRKRTQPLAAPSAGCIFQNPVPGRDVLPPDIPWSAGALIDRAGLKGRAIGDARVSSVHANFLVNEGHATAAEIRALVALCRAEVRAQFGVTLREEVVCLGDDASPMTE